MTASQRNSRFLWIRDDANHVGSYRVTIENERAGMYKHPDSWAVMVDLSDLLIGREKTDGAILIVWRT